MRGGSGVPCVLSPRALWPLPPKPGLSPGEGWWTSPRNARGCHANVELMLDHPELVQLVFSSSKVSLCSNGPSVGSVALKCLVSIHESCCLGRGRKRSSVFQTRLNFLFSRGTVDIRSQSIKLTNGAFLFPNKQKDVSLSLLGNPRKLQQGYITEHWFFSLCHSAKMKMFCTSLRGTHSYIFL